jgi:hypothetical protein
MIHTYTGYRLLVETDSLLLHVPIAETEQDNCFATNLGAKRILGCVSRGILQGYPSTNPEMHRDRDGTGDDALPVSSWHDGTQAARVWAARMP